MLERPGADYSVESLAEAAGMGRTTFAAGFKEAFGCPPVTLLGTGAVAKQVGFSSRTHFVDAVRRYTGKTPGDYRKAAS